MTKLSKNETFRFKIVVVVTLLGVVQYILLSSHEVRYYRHPTTQLITQSTLDSLAIWYYIHPLKFRCSKGIISKMIEDAHYEAMVEFISCFPTISGPAPTSLQEMSDGVVLFEALSEM